MHYKLPLLFEPQPEGGYTVTSPLLPELITEGDTIEDAPENVRDALSAVFEIYRENPGERSSEGYDGICRPGS
jgi:antitoxin HicB